MQEIKLSKLVTSIILLLFVNTNVTFGDNTGVEQFKMYLEFQNEIDETMFLAQQKAELALGESYVPCKILVTLK